MLISERTGPGFSSEDSARFAAEFAGLSRICRSTACRRADACIGERPHCFTRFLPELRANIFPLLRTFALTGKGLPPLPEDANAHDLAARWWRRLGWL